VARNKRRTPGTTTRGKKLSGNPARNVGKNRLTPGSTTQELDRLFPDLVRWYDPQGHRTDIRIAMAHLSVFYCVYMKASSIKTVTAMEPQVMIRILGILLALNRQQALRIARTLHGFLRFLRESGRWSGSHFSYLQAHTVLQAVAEYDLQHASGATG
jgi:hypothetical protein